MVRILSSARYRARRIVRKSAGVLSRLTALDPIYSREAKAVTAGIATYRRLTRETGSQALLRRNTHRLEKGLLMRPRRPVFAVEYIGETIDSLARILDRPDQSTAELQWTGDVLRKYFDETEPTSATSAARERFNELMPRLPEYSGAVPFPRTQSESLGVTPEGLLALARRRRSVRWFLPDRVPRELVRQAMLVAREAPSACNRQPFVFRVFDDPERVREIARIPMGTTGYGDQIPLLIVVVGQMRNFFDPRDRHLIYIDGALAGMSLILALETLGLASCVINWPDVEEREVAMRRILGLAADERPVFLIGVGYADPEGLIARSAKRPLEELLQFEP